MDDGMIERLTALFPYRFAYDILRHCQPSQARMLLGNELVFAFFILLERFYSTIAT
jgi:hypothetical protein